VDSKVLWDGCLAFTHIITEALDMPFIAYDKTCSIEGRNRSNDFWRKDCSVLGPRYYPFRWLRPIVDHSDQVLMLILRRIFPPSLVQFSFFLPSFNGLLSSPSRPWLFYFLVYFLESNSIGCQFACDGEELL
jgi:hypothetical protein